MATFRNKLSHPIPVSSVVMDCGEGPLPRVSHAVLVQLSSTIGVMKSGTLTVEDGCGGEETLTAGQAFEELDGRVHRGKNLTTEPVVVYNTFIMPEGKPTTRNIPNNEKRCGPPIDADECKDDGWLKFDHPSSFINQGQCIDYVRHRPRNVIPVPEDPLAP